MMRMSSQQEFEVLSRFTATVIAVVNAAAIGNMAGGVNACASGAG